MEQRRDGVSEDMTAFDPATGIICVRWAGSWTGARLAANLAALRVEILTSRRRTGRVRLLFARDSAPPTSG